MKPKVVVTIVVGVLIAFVYLIAYQGIVQSIVPNEIAKMQRELPMKIDDDMTLTEVYESGRTLYCVVVMDTDLSAEDVQLSPYDMEADKQTLIANFKREMGGDLEQLKKMVDGFVYLYQNKNGDELYRISIRVSEL